MPIGFAKPDADSCEMVENYPYFMYFHRKALLWKLW
jgi:hypothetical protein